MNSAMSESPDGKGVLLFGGDNGWDRFDRTNLDNIKTRIVKLFANSWTILDVNLQEERSCHAIIPTVQ